MHQVDPRSPPLAISSEFDDVIDQIPALRSSGRAWNRRDVKEDVRTTIEGREEAEAPLVVPSSELAGERRKR
ncbi:hypothetical protein GCM10011313_29310 [Mycetocola zhadangensis]|nr:hypothetical protein GCM10011313_29310 [Mycetocola zhadangensis]